jgi:CxxC motif-containing protein (DUF1111 family)
MVAAAVVAALAGCGGDDDGYQAGEELAGGDVTVFDETVNAYSHAAPNLVSERRDPFFVGNSFFNRSWVTAPSSTSGVDGLGPTFNARSCTACHTKDGRGRPPAEGEAMLSMLLRLSVPGVDQHGGPVPEPVYGGQLQPDALPGVPAEGRAVIEYIEQPGAYADGTPYSLRAPKYRIEDLAFGPLAPAVSISPRVAPAVFGLGLLELLPEADLLALADPDDRDQDGISGRANFVWDVSAQATVLGRFGWKANQPSLLQQTAGAFLGDIGVTSRVFPEQNCSPAQEACLAAPPGGAGGLPEIDDGKLDAVVYYGRTLAVPGRRDVRDPEVLHGKRLFRAAGCASCHVPRWTTGPSSELPELARQTIWPYTDLLLHDLGDALADGRPDFLADGREWRTPPLWGLGLLEVVNGHTFLLHDGRARDVAEAILWHGGEAEASREAFRTMVATDRAALLRFLGSL